MSTKVFFRQAQGTSPYQWSSGNNDAPLAGGTSGWDVRSLATTAGSGGAPNPVLSTVTGPTSGLEVGSGGTPQCWVSAPLDADVTISGTVTFNLWMSESNMSANVGAQCVIERIDSTGAIVSTVTNSEKGVELPVTTRAAQNWTAAPTSTGFLKGDRIRIRVAGNDVGTMATGFIADFGYDGGTAAADGDSFVTFTETFGFLTTDPTTTTIYPTTTASDIDPGGSGTDTKEAWTARGAGSTNAVRNTAAGWTAPLQATVSAGGNLVEWFTKQLTAFTLAAPVLANVRALESTTSANTSVRAEIAVTDSDGTHATVWAATSHPTELTTSDAAQVLYLAGDDVAVTDGQRIRLRVYIDDMSTTAMGASLTVTVSYAGTSGGASGDTFLTFGQTLTEFVAAAAGIPQLTMAPLGHP